MRIRLAVLVILTVLLVSSCSCLRRLAGTVRDRETKKPIQTARISVTNPGYQRHFESDSNGYFEAFLSGGYKCPRISVRIEADGYKALDMKEPRKRDTITVYLERLK
ncbi:hypothetical protein ACFOET_02290 [Parapedobacter deserti]|uniref:Carboxypeptidase regulatory-like domain-containing protein n=1 Tax=Parapedobacter deserti TaxID=1912957 RepID=A0ABV7JHU4_9SPHI